MSQRKIISILGATGAQGGGLARAILNDENSEFSVRAITRNPGSEPAEKLLDAGAEVVKADLDDLESLEEAFSGSYGVYGVTFSWEHLSPEKELGHAQNIAKAAKKADVQHVIWSTLEDTREYLKLDDDRMPVLHEKYNVPHFDVKGEANQYFKDHNLPTTFLHTSFYWENLTQPGSGLRKSEDGKWILAMPLGDKKLPGIAAEDIGKAVYGILKQDKHFVGRSVGLAAEHLTGEEMAAGMAEILGEDVVYQPVPFDVYRNLGFPGSDDLGNMFQFKHDFSEAFQLTRNPALTSNLNPNVQNWRAWLRQNKDLFTK